MPMAESGPETWMFNGKTYHVNRTFYVTHGIKSVVYIIEWSVGDKSVLFGMTDEGALKIAFPLMVYAYQSHAYERAEFKALRGNEPARTLIGVDLIAGQGGVAQGYRIIQSIGEIVGRLNRDGGVE
jgi:hypothetical protein